MDAVEKAFDNARDTSKLATTLSAGIIAFTVTFSKESGGFQPGASVENIMLALSWVFLLGSSIVGIWTQLAITDSLDPKIKQGDYQPSIRAKKIIVPFRIQLLSFIGGVLILVVYGAVRLFY
jgi:hypothetical protein